MKIHYHPQLKQLSRNLRNQSTLSEVLMWDESKGKKIRDYQFMPQKPVGQFFADFYCSKLNLVIEIDGESHETQHQQLKDHLKDEYLNSLGISVLRYDDHDVKTDLSGVMEHLIGWIEKAEIKMQHL
jgi:very-short-patch-repair endonuclease